MTENFVRNQFKLCFQTHCCEHSLKKTIWSFYLLYVFIKLTSMPAMKIETKRGLQLYLCPFRAAWCNGVYPEPSVQFTFRPFHMLRDRHTAQLMFHETLVYPHILTVPCLKIKLFRSPTQSVITKLRGVHRV